MKIFFCQYPYACSITIKCGVRSLYLAFDASDTEKNATKTPFLKYTECVRLSFFIKIFVRLAAQLYLCFKGYLLSVTSIRERNS